MAGRILSAHPIIRDIAAAAVQAAANRMSNTTAAPMTRTEVTAAVKETAEAIAADPVAVNNLNVEPKSQSRIVSGSTVASGGGGLIVLYSLVNMIRDLQAHDYAGFWNEVPIFLVGGAAGGGGLFALIGRLRHDMSPMVFKPLNPLTWFAPHIPAGTVATQ